MCWLSTNLNCTWYPIFTDVDLCTQAIEVSKTRKRSGLAFLQKDPIYLDLFGIFYFIENFWAN
jgi:hypothetical protein